MSMQVGDYFVGLGFQLCV